MLSALQNGSNGTRTRELAGPVNRIPTLLDQFFQEGLLAPFSSMRTAIPLAMWEDEDHFYVEVDAPGMTNDEIDVSIHNGTLLIRGERKRRNEAAGFDSRAYGGFEQRISLPNWARAENIRANLANGVLSLAFPKGEEAKPKKIAIQVT